jgi:hypothetical protein
MRLYLIKYNYCYTHDVEFIFEAETDAEAKNLAMVEVSKHNEKIIPDLYCIGVKID